MSNDKTIMIVGEDVSIASAIAMAASKSEAEILIVDDEQKKRSSGEKIDEVYLKSEKPFPAMMFPIQAIDLPPAMPQIINRTPSKHRNGKSFDRKKANQKRRQQKRARKQNRK